MEPPNRSSAHWQDSGAFRLRMESATVTAPAPAPAPARPVPFENVSITSAFWASRIRVVQRGALPAMQTQMKDTGRWDCLKLQWKPGDPNKPYVSRRFSVLIHLLQGVDGPYTYILTYLHTYIITKTSILVSHSRTVRWSASALFTRFFFQGFGHSEMARSGVLYAQNHTRSDAEPARRRSRRQHTGRTARRRVHQYILYRKCIHCA